MNSVEYLRGLGFERITLKTGSYGMEELAMAIKFATDADLDLLTIDGSGGGTGMSPWNMMQSWGVPSINLHAKAHEYASILSAKGKHVVDMSFAGGFALEVGKTAAEIFSGNRETAQETGIPHVTDVNNESAKKNTQFLIPFLSEVTQGPVPGYRTLYFFW